MPLDGLRAWIGELERKLGARTRIGLVLVALAVGAGGAGIYLALDTASNSVSKDDLQSLQEQVELGGAGVPPSTDLESRLGAAESAAAAASAEIAKLKAKVEALEGGGKGGSDAGIGSIPDEGESGSSAGEGKEATRTGE